MKRVLLSICQIVLAVLFCSLTVQKLGEAELKPPIPTQEVWVEVVPESTPEIKKVEPIVEPKVVPKVAPVEKTLDSLAQDKMNDLVKTRHWSHTNSDGCTFECRTKGYISQYQWIGENLYSGPCNIDNAYRLWEKSIEHAGVLNHPYSEEVILIEEYDTNKCYIILERALR